MVELAYRENPKLYSGYTIRQCRCIIGSEAEVFLDSFGIIGIVTDTFLTSPKRVLKKLSIFQDISELCLCNILDFRILGRYSLLNRYYFDSRNLSNELVTKVCLKRSFLGLI